MEYSIYMAGAIKGKSYSESENWRDYVKAHMPSNIICYSPLRAKQFLRKYDKIGMGGLGTDTYDHESPLSTARGIMTRDHFDCKRADLIFCNLLGTTAVSMGTCMEIAWAFSYRIPLVVCIEPGNIHDHPMIREATNFTVDNIYDGINLVKTILLP